MRNYKRMMIGKILSNQWRSCCDRSEWVHRNLMRLEPWEPNEIGAVRINNLHGTILCAFIREVNVHFMTCCYAHSWTCRVTRSDMLLSLLLSLITQWEKTCCYHCCSLLIAKMSEPKILTLNLNYFPKISLRLKLEEQTWKIKVAFTE